MCSLYTYCIFTTGPPQQNNDQAPSSSSTTFQLKEYFLTVFDKLRTTFYFKQRDTEQHQQEQQQLQLQHHHHHPKIQRRKEAQKEKEKQKQKGKGKQKQKESPNASESAHWQLRSFEGRSSSVCVDSPLTLSGGCRLRFGSTAVESSSSVASSSDQGPEAQPYCSSAITSGSPHESALTNISSNGKKTGRYLFIRDVQRIPMDATLPEYKGDLSKRQQRQTSPSAKRQKTKQKGKGKAINTQDNNNNNNNNDDDDDDEEERLLTARNTAALYTGHAKTIYYRKPGATEETKVVQISRAMKTWTCGLNSSVLAKHVNVMYHLTVPLNKINWLDRHLHPRQL
ncbi:hypothetical protein INT45_002745 [Circinella minor]|uniref:Uncharacterized protein n=1 Tax=Circinella minor TaxID=1195481 RepID=A0A8H7VK01_9FUNG|nr:hypothetical protein INT45_002745 [Circinella minor]